MNEDAMRKAFEAWALKNWANCDDMERGRLTGYKNTELNMLWVGWQAATRAAVPAWNPIDEALTKDAERFRALGVCELQIYAYGHSPVRWMASFTARTKEGRPYKHFVTGPEDGGSFADTASAVDAAVAAMCATKANEAT